MNVVRIASALAVAAGLVVVAALGASAASKPEVAQAAELRVITHNICGGACLGGELSATDPVLEQVDVFGPDIIMLQETCYSQYEHVLAELGSEYSGDFSPMKSDHKCGGDGDMEIGQALITKGTMDNKDLIDLGGDSYGNDGKDYTGLCYDLTLTDLDLAPGGAKACVTHIRAFHDELWHNRARWAQLGKLASEMDDDVFADGQVVVLGGDFNDVPSERSLDPLYQLAGDNDAGGLGAFVEADQTDPDLCADPAPGCRSGDPTKDTRKLDYVFFDAQHAQGRLSGGVIQTDLGDHELFRGLAEITVE